MQSVDYSNTMLFYQGDLYFQSINDILPWYNRRLRSSYLPLTLNIFDLLPAVFNSPYMSFKLISSINVQQNFTKHWKQTCNSADRELAFPIRNTFNISFKSYIFEKFSFFDLKIDSAWVYNEYSCRIVERCWNGIDTFHSNKTYKDKKFL